MRTQTFTLFASFLAVLTSFTSLAQPEPLLVAGRIFDADTGEPIACAHVGIAERGIGTTSGHGGRFELKLEPGLRTAKHDGRTGG